MTPVLSAAAVAAVVRGYRFTFANEYDLQDGIGEALKRAGYRVEREKILDPRSRIDLLIDGRVGVEVKIGGEWRDVAEQCSRYLAHVDELVLVTGKAAHIGLENPRLEVVSLLHNGL